MCSQKFAMTALVIGAMAGSVSMPVQAQQKKKPVLATSGQAQLNGLNAQFGTIYTLKSKFNFEILKARYTMEPFASYGIVAPQTDQKVLVVDIAIKNTIPSDNFFNVEGFASAFDEKGQQYNFGSGCLALKSLGRKSPNTNLKPGQGLGQPALNDPLEMAVVLPAKARIVKIILNTGRLGTSDSVMRYYVAGATKEEAGETGNPSNIIAPMPENVRDTSDKSGAVALTEGIGKIGEYEPSRKYGLKLEDISVSTEKFKGEAAPEGKKFVVATITAKLLIDENSQDIGEVTGGDYPLYAITDADGERYKPYAYRKSRTDEDADHRFQLGDEYKFRIVFLVPKDAPLKKLTLGAGGGPKWIYDISNIK